MEEVDLGSCLIRRTETDISIGALEIGSPLGELERQKQEGFYLSRIESTQTAPQSPSFPSPSAQSALALDADLCHNHDFYQLKWFRWLLVIILIDTIEAVFFVLVIDARGGNLLVDGARHLAFYFLLGPQFVLSYITVYVFYLHGLKPKLRHFSLLVYPTFITVIFWILGTGLYYWIFVWMMTVFMTCCIVLVYYVRCLR